LGCGLERIRLQQSLPRPLDKPKRAYIGFSIDLFGIETDSLKRSLKMAATLTRGAIGKIKGGDFNDTVTFKVAIELKCA
jgi:hypothetical protein